jgi:hypothetical protein
MAKVNERHSDQWASRSHPVKEDMKGQLLFWKGQRIGWIILCAVLGAAFLGAFSEGLFSWKTVVAGGGRLKIEHQRFYRKGASSDMVLHIDGGEGGTERNITLDHGLAGMLTLETISPEPVRSESRRDGLHLVFASPAQDGGPIYITLRPIGVGSADGFVTLDETEARARVKFFIFP